MGSGLFEYFRRAPADPAEARSYNVLQRTAYLGVIFVLFPLVIWSGLAIVPCVRFRVSIRGECCWADGNRRARCTSLFPALLVVFLVVHVVMVAVSGFRSRMRAMITGHVRS